MRKKTDQKTTDKADIKDTLLTDLAAELNKSNKDGGQIAFSLEEQEDPSVISDWISTGSSLLDLAISNRPNGGFPVGRLVEVTGLEGAGKSLIAANVIANTQKKGGKAIYIDTENAAAPEFWKSVGMDMSPTKLVYIQTETVESIFSIIEKSIAYIRKDNPDMLLTIVVDSVANSTTEVEAESNHGKDGYATGKAIIISKAMRKITSMIGREKVLVLFTNQLRLNMSAGSNPHADKYTVSGGKALGFACSVRIRVSKTGVLKKGDQAIGTKCKAVVKKNRMGPSERKAEFDIYFDSGIADYASWLSVLRDNGTFRQAGAYYKYKTKAGEELQFQSKDFIKLMNDNAELKQEVYDTICEHAIMKYKDPNSKIESDIEESDLDEFDKEENKNVVEAD
jgi:recombination protein RecA